MPISTPRMSPDSPQELSRMEKQGVTRLHQPTDWCAGMVVVLKIMGSPHCNAILTKLNKMRETHPMPAVEQTLAEQLAGAKVLLKLNANSEFWQIPVSTIMLLADCAAQIINALPWVVLSSCF